MFKYWSAVIVRIVQDLKDFTEVLKSPTKISPIVESSTSKWWEIGEGTVEKSFSSTSDIKVSLNIVKLIGSYNDSSNANGEYHFVIFSGVGL